MHTLPIRSAELLPASPPATRRTTSDFRVPNRATALLSDFFPGLALAVVLFTAVELAGARELLAVGAGVAALLYLGTALLSGSLLLAALDLGAAAAAVSLSVTGEPDTVAAAWLVHALWGIARSTLAGTTIRRHPSNWSAMAGGLAILALLS